MSDYPAENYLFDESQFDISFKGAVCGVGVITEYYMIDDEEKDHTICTLLIEDDGNWIKTNYSFDVLFIDDLIEQLLKVKKHVYEKV